MNPGRLTQQLQRFLRSFALCCWEIDLSLWNSGKTAVIWEIPCKHPEKPLSHSVTASVPLWILMVLVLCIRPQRCPAASCTSPLLAVLLGVVRKWCRGSMCSPPALCQV